jgi:predicted lipoprotein with Yx(FWY)xxD motif
MIVRRLAALAAVLALLAAACSSDGDTDTATTDETPTAEEPATAEPAEEAPADTDSAPAAAGVGIALTTSDLGEIIVDDAGNTLYLFVPDTQGASTCYDECEANWPVVGEVTDVGDGLDAALLGTTERTNGDVQATYNGWPLYYFANDAAAGDTNGQGVGDIWYVVDASGNAIGL